MMKDRPKLTLVSNNPNLKTYYIPLTTMTCEIYPVKATSESEALFRANQGHIGSIVKKIVLQERYTNDVYLDPDMPTADLFSRQIDDFEVDINNFDYPIPPNKS